MAAGPSMTGKEGLEVYGPRVGADRVALEEDSSSSRACLVGLRDGLSSGKISNGTGPKPYGFFLEDLFPKSETHLPHRWC
ncbi:hypothetical protein E2562_015677 [Oryza meyeriana var. granulata]|uniref:Uncharacterized protein n=1 Tax=Oryza meyeriana var. granulata TaxID=110450 RepID=A0A6G1D4U8_9ORYZ|nr:hypothetical protein E2562_015677 [Oryza meyeriana var. granulata]